MHDVVEIAFSATVVMKLDGDGSHAIQPVKVSVKYFDLGAFNIYLQQIHAGKPGSLQDRRQWKSPDRIVCRGGIRNFLDLESTETIRRQHSTAQLRFMAPDPRFENLTSTCRNEAVQVMRQ